MDGRMKKNRKLPVFATAGAAIYGLNAYAGYKGVGGAGSGVNGLKWNTLGIDNAGVFHWDKFLANSLPLIVGVGGSMVAARTGMNRYISAIPFVKM